MQNKVAELRRKRGMSQQELAEKASVSRTYLSQIETNPDKAVTNVVMFRIAKALNVNAEDIFLP